jgi:subtilisin family serine protease
VNNSWGGEITDDASMTWFSSAVKAWLAGGIFPIFAQGNSGPACGTVGTPGDLEDVIGVGAVDQFGSLTVFSSRGPGGSRLGHAQFKPDYVAPGQAIVSCKPGGELIAMSGTSMAAPHVAGIAALLLSMKGDLKFDELRTLITKTINTSALKEPQMGQQACYGKRWDHFPNYHYGFGLVDTEAAAKALQA